MSFQVPLSSTPPSTPGSRRIEEHPSTTPAGPPPTFNLNTAGSFTPAGPPPTSVFGSSQAGTSFKPSNGPLFSFNKPASGSASIFSRPEQASQPAPSLFSTNNAKPFDFPPAQTARYPSLQSSPPLIDLASSRQPGAGYGFGDDDQEDYEEEDYEEEDEQSMDNDADMEQDQKDMTMDDLQPARNAFDIDDFLKSSVADPRGTKRARHDNTIHAMSVSRLPPELDMTGIAKSIAAGMPEPSLHEPGDFIFSTEDTISKLPHTDPATGPPDELTIIAQQLKTQWENFAGIQTTRSTSADHIGPTDDDPWVRKCLFLVSFVITLYLPSNTQPRPEPPTAGLRRSQGTFRPRLPPKKVAIPMLLLEWLNTYHDPSAIELEQVLAQKSGYSASPAFWDVIFSSLLRGKLTTVIKLLNGANFRNAYTAGEDGYPSEAGYTGGQLAAVNDAVAATVAVLEQCPAVTAEDWDVKGAQWALYRRRVQQAIRDMRVLAENGEPPEDDDDFDPGEAFGASRGVGSLLPIEIAEYLIDVLMMFMCIPDEVLKSSCDWVEAVIGLAVWWDGDEEDVEADTYGASHYGNKPERRSRMVDVTPALAYRKRLFSALVRVLHEGEKETQLGINTLNPNEVGLASIMVGDTQGVLGILKGWSITVAATVAELADAGQWLQEQQSKTGNLMNTFDKSDLMVLDIGNGDDGSDLSLKDRYLKEYATLLSKEDTVEGGEEQVEGWEVAVRVLSRLSDAAKADAEITRLLETISITTHDRVEKLLNLCQELGLPDYSKEITERFADNIASSGDEFGQALLYYARARNPEKIKEVLHTLTSRCLVQSRAYPPTDALDPQLKAFIDAPKTSLTQLARVDPEAAEVLSRYLSGYATLRRFYVLRDQEFDRSSGKPPLRPLERRRQAAAALVGVIESAADSIRGGLFDPDVDVVVQVGCLLTLLAEALAFVNQPQCILTTAQIFTLLRVTEDLQTVSARIFAQNEELLKSAIQDYRSHPVANKSIPSLAKSTSVLTTASSQFSFAGSSEMTDSAHESGNPSAEGSGVLIKGPKKDETNVSRGWDWRKGLPRGVGGKEVVQLLRMALSKEVARAWTQGDGEAVSIFSTKW